MKMNERMKEYNEAMQNLADAHKIAEKATAALKAEMKKSGIEKMSIGGKFISTAKPKPRKKPVTAPEEKGE